MHKSGCKPDSVWLLAYCSYVVLVFDHTLQKIRTVELDGKVIKLQIVSQPACSLPPAGCCPSLDVPGQVLCSCQPQPISQLHALLAGVLFIC